jgi:hypothetical protein
MSGDERNYARHSLAKERIGSVVELWLSVTR